LDSCQKFIKLPHFAPLFGLDRTKWYSLQRGASAEVAAYPQVTDLGNIDPPDARFCETAAVVSLLDAVVCIDSSVGHLAGALSTPAYILLGGLYDPQCGVTRQNALFYPTHKVRRGALEDLPHFDWSYLIAEVENELKAAIFSDTLKRPKGGGDAAPD
jgi:hypothetical protein